MKVHQALVQITLPARIRREHRQRFWEWVAYFLGAGMSVEIRNG